VSIGHRVEDSVGAGGRGSGYRTPYRATTLHALAPLEVVAPADERTYQDPGRPNRQVSRALPVVSVTTDTRR
jgi:hypothetical protein